MISHVTIRTLRNLALRILFFIKTVDFLEKMSFLWRRECRKILKQQSRIFNNHLMLLILSLKVMLHWKFCLPLIQLSVLKLQGLAVFAFLRQWSSSSILLTHPQDELRFLPEQKRMEQMLDPVASRPLQTFDIMLIQRVHFRSIHEYLPQLVRHCSLLPFLADKSLIIKKVALTAGLERGESILYLCEEPISKTSLFLLEERKMQTQTISYRCDSQQKNVMNSAVCLTATFKLELEILSPQKVGRNLLKIKVCRQTASQDLERLFPVLRKLKATAFVAKSNYYDFLRHNEMAFPFRMMNSSEQGSKQTILLFNQGNIRETLYFLRTIQQFHKERNGISKIIGHPATIFLVFSINKEGAIDERVASILGNPQPPRKERSFSSSQLPSKDKILLSVKNLLLGMLSQQHILDVTLVQFLVESIVNPEFISNFIEIVRLYYKAFLNEELPKSQIQAELESSRISRQNPHQGYLNYFSSIFDFIEFRHNYICKDLLAKLEGTVNGKAINTLTLLDLYEHNKIEFTFVGFDIDDRILRLFNHYTAPHMPITAIVSLAQFLPVPFKSITWQSSWGYYYVRQQKCLKLVDITSHQIIDSRFIIETPHSLVKSQAVRKTYFTDYSSTPFIHSVSMNSRKKEDSNDFEQLKVLLKAMKSNAVDSIPKLKLIWKVLTTKNQIQINFNEIESFRQVPLLSKVLKLDETYKRYLQNFNKQAHQGSFLRVKLPVYAQRKQEISEMLSNIKKLKELINNLSSNIINEKGEDDLYRQINQIKSKLVCEVLSYDQMLQVLALFNTILKQYNLFQKYIYRIQLEKIIRQTEQDNMLDFQKIRDQLRNLAQMLEKSRLKNRVSLIEPELTKTVSLFRDSREIGNSFDEFTQIDIIKDTIAIYQDKLAKFNQDIKDHKETNEKFQNLACQYERIMFKTSNIINKALQSKTVTLQTKKLYSHIFSISPQLYNIQQLKRNEFIIQNIIKASLTDSAPRIHLVLGGNPQTLIQEASMLITLRAQLKQSGKVKITHITATNHHAVLAMLFCLHTSKLALVEEIVGLNHLISTHNEQFHQDNIDVDEFYLSNRLHKESFNQSNGKQDYERRTFLLRKYQNLYAVLCKLQAFPTQARELTLSYIYEHLQRYDLSLNDADILFKQMQIIKYLNMCIKKEEERQVLQDLLAQNEKMIKQKIQMNKIGIRFIIRFLYRDSRMESNWIGIHTERYLSLQVYRLYLHKLMKKYNIKWDITLEEFNRTNYHQIQLHFVLMNLTAGRFQSISSSSQYHLKLIDLLLAVLSQPLSFPKKRLPSFRATESKCFEYLIDRLENRLVDPPKDDLYWSNYTINSFPFDMISLEADQRLLSLQTVIHFPSQKMHRSSLKPTSQIRKQTYFPLNQTPSVEDKGKMRAIDLISLWWTKSKKLTPQMKAIIFGNIFSSPFVEYYLFIRSSQLFGREKNIQKTILQMQDEGRQPNKGKSSQIIHKIEQISLLFRLSFERGYYELDLLQINAQAEVATFINDQKATLFQKTKVCAVQQGCTIKLYVRSQNSVSIIVLSLNLEEFEEGNIKIHLSNSQPKSKYQIRVFSSQSNSKQDEKVIESVSEQSSHKFFIICSSCGQIRFSDAEFSENICSPCKDHTILGKKLCLFIDEQVVEQSVGNIKAVHRKTKNRSNWKCCF